MIKTRFAPSPTGFLHIGGVRTALFSWLYARRMQGRFVLRIEDTDQERSTKQSIDAILHGMEWLGLDADEGPYYQMQRLDRYREVADQWLREGTAYRCYCTRQELDEMRAVQVARGENPRYDGRCRTRSKPREDVAPAIRFRFPESGQVTVDDLVRGRVTFDNTQFDDFVIVRSDGVPTYNFSVVIDDSDMAITHVIRGDDHLNNTPKQINLLKAMGKELPVYAHLPMILGADGSRLSKRHGAVNVLDYRDEGYLPEALLNYLVRLGWSHGDQEIFSREEMIAFFDVADVNASASAFNPEKLKWLNQQYIIRTPVERLAELLAGQYKALELEVTDGPSMVAVAGAYRERANTLREMAIAASYSFIDTIDIDAASAKKHLRPVVLEPLRALRNRFDQLDQWQASALTLAIDEVATQHGINMGKLGQPVRVAITGTAVSPPIDVTLELVGRNRALTRIDAAIQFIEKRAAGMAVGSAP